jgi:hypothetical protein
MARKLVNELTWSVSRDSLFSTCQRAYYYNYYGSWGGWERGCDPATRKLYILKNITSLPMWAGSIVHDVIAEALRRHARNQSGVRAGELQARARQKLRGGWIEAVNQEWKTSPKKTNLLELYYGNGKSLPREQTEACKARVNDCLASFAGSPVLAEILAASYLSWRPVDQLDSFLLGGDLKVWCAIDFAFTDPAGKLRIVDWKTGGEKPEALQLQLACYALYAMDQWHTPLESLDLCGVFLAEGARVSRYPINEPVLAEAKDRILSSAAGMRAPLADPTANRAEEEDFPVAEQDWPCRTCNFREVCPKWQ